MSFFEKEENKITPNSLEENLLSSFKYNYGLYYLYTEIFPYGGPILITEDFSATSTHRPMSEILSEYLIVFSQDGSEK